MSKKYLLLLIVIITVAFHQDIYRFYIINFQLKKYVCKIDENLVLKDEYILKKALVSDNKIISIYAYKNLQLFHDLKIMKYLADYVKQNLLKDRKKVLVDKSVIPDDLKQLVPYINKLSNADYRIRNYLLNKLNAEEKQNFIKTIYPLKDQLLKWCAAWEYAKSAKSERYHLLNVYFAYAEEQHIKDLIKRLGNGLK